MTHSMTGFARVEHEHSWGRLSCEIRSVNHRYLEVALRIPDSLRVAESKVRDQIKAHLSRGKVEVSIFIRQESDKGEAINIDALAHLTGLIKSVEQNITMVGSANPLEVLRWPGILQAVEIEPEALAEAADSALIAALNELKNHRAREGEGLKNHIEDRLTAIESHVATLRKEMPELVKAQQEKLSQKIEALNVEVDKDRLAQELVIIAQKADVAEELDRLETHIQETIRTLKKTEPIGRRLDFLMQEFNREANTLSSKAIASGVTQVAVELKVLIEQMREQVQNIE